MYSIKCRYIHVELVNFSINAYLDCTSSSLVCCLVLVKCVYMYIYLSECCNIILMFNKKKNNNIIIFLNYCYYYYYYYLYMGICVSRFLIFFTAVIHIHRFQKL